MASMTSSLSRPGSVVPTIPSIPGWPVLGNLLAFRKDRLALHAQAARIGPIARFSVLNIPIYSVCDADLAHEVLVTKAASFHKGAGMRLLKPVLGEGLLTSEGATHRQHRKLLAPVFAPKRLAAYGEAMVAETRKQIARWLPGQEIDLAREMMEMTLAIAGRTMFAADVRDDARTIGDGIELALRSMVASLTWPLPLGSKWPLPRHLAMKRAVKMLDTVVYRMIADGRKLGTDRGDVLSMLLLARDETDGTGLTDREVRDEVMTLFLAGHETTANALTWTWHELGRNSAVLARLEEEVGRVVGDRAVTSDDLPNLPWTLAVLEEAMRLHPPVYQMSREVSEPVTIGGHDMPPRSIVLINVFGMHRRADYYPAPLAFRPERMLAEAKKLRPRHHYLPFGAGPRVCMASHFALLETVLCLATMIQHVRVRPVSSHAVPDPRITLRPHGGLPAFVEPK